MPGGESAYERGGDARRKFWIKPLKETDLGVAQVFLTPKRDHVKTQTIWIFLYFFKCNPKRNMMAFCPEHPKSDQNPKFTPLSETKSIPTPFICGVPPPGVDVRIVVTSAQNTCQGKHAIALCYHKHYDRMRKRHAAVAMNEVAGDWKNWGLFFLWFISSMCSFIACCISDRRSRTQIGFDQFAPSACQQEIWDTRLLSQKGVDVTSGAQFAALPLFDKDFELHAPSLPSSS